jgi:esterase/lipase
MARDNINNISKVNCPTLVMIGDCDNLVSIKSVKFVYDKLKCKKDLVIINKVRHQIFKSYKKDIITKYIYKFISFKFLYKISKRKMI